MIWLTRLIIAAILGAFGYLIYFLSTTYNLFYAAFLGSLGAAFVIVIAVFITIGIYLFIDNHKKKIKDSSYRIIFFIALFVIGLAIRVGCALAVNAPQPNEDVVMFFGRGIQTLYFTIAGVGFEGQDIAVDSAKAVHQMWCTIGYFSSMLWLAASYIVIITAGISYGAYSFFLKLWFRIKGRSEYYIFTNLTEDTLALADSIHDEKNNKAYIIFAGNELEKFDNSNELHRKLRIRKYPYITTSKIQVLEEDSKFRFSSIFKLILGYRNKNRHNSVLIDLGLLTWRKLRSCSFHIFALGIDKDLKGLESENSDFIFDDIQGNLYHKTFYKRVIRNYILFENDNPYFRINYYVLTNNSTNHEFYTKNLRRVIVRFEKDIVEAQQEYRENHKFLSCLINKKIDNYQKKVTFERLRLLFKINVVNEASLAGQSLIKARHKIEKERIIVNNKINYTGEGDDNDHVAVFLGFGQTGQVALNNLFVDTAYVNFAETPEKSGIASRFIAHVFDENIVDYAGQFEKNHPSYLISDVDEKEEVGDILLEYLNNNKELKEKKKEEYRALLEEYLNNDNDKHYSNEESLKAAYGKEFFKNTDFYLKFPHIYLHKKNVNSLSLLRGIDSSLGTDRKELKEWKKFNSIVIALGNDEDNIAMANTILQDLRQELYSGKNKNDNRPIDIYVNVRDAKNSHRLNWNTTLEKIVHPNINVATFGNADDMYSYDSIINNLKISMLNSNYNLAGDSSDNFDYMNMKNPHEVNLKEVETTYNETINNLRSLMVIEGFLNSLKRKHFKHHEKLFREIYSKLILKLYGKIGIKALLNNALTRHYSGLKELTGEFYNKYRGDWDLRKDYGGPLKHYKKSKEEIIKLIKEENAKPDGNALKNLGFDSYEDCLAKAKIANIEIPKHFKRFEEELNYDDFATVIKGLCVQALLKKENGKYLLTLEEFIGLFGIVYKRVSLRKRIFTSWNRKMVIRSRMGKREGSFGDEIFLDISRTQRSFYLGNYETDSTRFLLSFLDYYHTLYFKDLKREEANLEGCKLDRATRSALGQLEHLRWSRYMMSRGSLFTYNDLKNPTGYTDLMDNSPIYFNTGFMDKDYMKAFLKLHKDIVPYKCHEVNDGDKYLADYLEIYDYINALCASFIIWEDVGK